MRRFLPLIAIIFVAAMAFALVAFAGQNPENDAGTTHGVNPTFMDTKCKPCEDFFKYADGGWVAAHPIPAAYPSWGTFNALAEENSEKLRGILEEAEKAKAAKGTNTQKIGDFYASGMNEAQIESEGIKPLEPEFERIEKIKDRNGLEDEIAHLHKEGIGVLFRFSATPDFKNSSMEIANASQGGLGLPDRDYYLTDKQKPIRDKYETHVANMLQLLGDSPDKAQAEAKVIMSVETSLAKASMTRVEVRNPDNTYHKMDNNQLGDLTPSFSWDRYFTDLGVSGVKGINVAQPDFFKQVSQLLDSVSLVDWKVYLRWHLIDGTAQYLPSKFVNEQFDFQGKVLTGAKELQPRWRRVVTMTDRSLGEALGQQYVKKYFPPEAKASALRMVNNLIDSLRADIQTLDWMGPETKQQALAKLDHLIKKIGYPDKWIDYSALKVDRGPFVLNGLRAHEFAVNRQLNKIGKPVDRTEFGMTPPTVNAFYNPTINEIVFPAGILQPPFYDAKADDASNYGGMGAVIGHEMTHGFDDEGRKFDAYGNLKDWWTPADMKNFQERAQCVEDQFNSYEVMPGIHENGKLVLGESIADLGGLTIAFKAFEMTPEGKSKTEIDGFTPQQRFFLAYAQVWAGSDRPEFEKLMVNLNPHPLDRFRAIAAASNMPQFAEAFHCKEGDAMVRATSKRCQIW
ncbi:MAG: M13 family metallopeptidase [Blastocatellia bacterium]